MSTMIHQLKSALPILTGVLIAASSGGASAQNALGNGTALGSGTSLDANTGQNGTRNYQRPSFTNELSFRNAIATGNAPGGLSFRGDLGYRAAGEFSGQLGSDSLFAFRRDSLYSGLAGMGIRGTDAIQYQFALTTGATPPRNLMGNLSLARDDYYNPSQYTPSHASGVRAQNTGTNPRLGIDQSAAQLDLRGKQLSATVSTPDAINGVQSSSMLGSLRSSSTYATTSTLQPALISLYTQGIDNKPIGLIASPLLGITSTPMVQQDPLAANPLVTRPPNANTDPNTPGGLTSTKVISSYDELVSQMRDHVEEVRNRNANTEQTTIRVDESNDSWLIRQMQDLREKLYGVKPANEDGQDTNTDQDTDPNADPSAYPSTDPNDPAVTDPSDPTQSHTPSPLSTLPDASQSPVSKAIEDALKNANANAREFELYDPTSIAIDPETLEVLRGAAANEIEKLLDPGADRRDLYAEHMLAGQSLIADGRYFDAEERFTHALSIQPGNIPAQLGRLHAQIGAGMVLSAAVNLQALFSMHPEVIASKYTGNLLPTRQRIESLLIRLKERSGITKPERSLRFMESEQIRVSSAVLVAYLGYQIDNQDDVISGLEMVKEVGADIDRRFVSLLWQIWIKDNASPLADPMGAPDAD